MKILAIRKLTATPSRPEGMKLKEIKDFFISRGIDFENEVNGNENGYGFFNGEKIVFFVNAFFPDRPAFYMDADFNEYFRCEECKQFHKKSEVNFLAINYFTENIAEKGIVCSNCIDKFQKDLIYAQENNGLSVWFEKKNARFIDGEAVSFETMYRGNGTLTYVDYPTSRRHLFCKTSFVEAFVETEKCYYFTEEYYQDNPDKFFVCKDCGRLFYSVNSFKKQLDDGSCLCKKCFENNYVETIEGQVIRKENAVAVELIGNDYITDGYYAADDPRLVRMKKCAHCGRYSNRTENILGENYCRSCRQHLDLAGYHYVNIESNGVNRTVYLDEDEKENFYVPKKVDGEKTKMFFGFEIETYQNRKNVVWIHDKYGDLFNCERDGSLDSTYGVEMISQPMSWNYLLANKERIGQLFSTLIAAGARGHDAGSGYGLHIHVSRDAFVSEEAECFANTLLNGFAGGVETIARRRGTSYCEYAENFDRVVKKNSYTKHSGHYCSLNFEHRSTVEFRVFRSTLNINTLMATVEFVKNIVEMSNALASEEITNKYSKFYHLKRVSFFDLLDGEYLPAYVEERKRNNAYFPTTSIDFNGYFVKDKMIDYRNRTVSINVGGRDVSVVSFYFANRNAFNALGVNYTYKDLKEFCEKQGKEVSFFKKSEKTVVSPKSIERIKRKQEENRKRKMIHHVTLEKFMKRMGVKSNVYYCY